MKRGLLVVLAVVVGLPLLAAAIGLVLPRDHVATMTIDLAAPPDRVWALVSDFGGTPAWRRDVTAVRVESSPGGPFRFTETTSQGDVTFEVVSQNAPKGQVVRVVDDDQPFGGTWTWVLDANGGGSRLTITEAGFIKNPLFRTMGALFFSPSATIDAYLRALAKHLGDTAEPKDVTPPGGQP